MRKALIILLFFLAAGCSAEVRERDAVVGKIIESFDGEPVVPRSANRLFIQQPSNSTGVEGLGPRLLYRLRGNISLDGRLGVDDEEAGSDLRLEIRISKYIIEKMKYDEIGRPVEKRVWMTADVRLLDLRKNREIFSEEDIQSFRTFSDLVQPIETETQAADFVLDDMAKRITSKTVTGWYTDRMTIIEKRKP
ncbi:MAG: hypothetical protein JW807_16550 [Spirochaetes bacterium]|nr:hypothetical protein [Spirochaetota bacterium]